MLNFSSKIHYYLFRGPVDMRKSFNGLSGLIHRDMGSDSLSGDIYLFVNRRADRIKFMVWDGDGFWIYYKRLEKGSFRLPPLGETRFEITYSDLVLMLEGIDLKKGKKRLRFGR